ncbi:MAG: hypothetical protein ACLQHF_04370 [Terracidiphilus sp.]
MTGLAMPGVGDSLPTHDPKNMVDLSNAVIVVPRELSEREKKAVQVLVEEAEKRTAIRWEVAEEMPANAPVAIVVGSQSSLKGSHAALLPELNLSTELTVGAEGYRLRTVRRPVGSVIAIIGVDERGVLFGVGEFLRKIYMTKGKVFAPSSLDLSSAPKYKLRGHQMGYRPKTNAYDAWTVAIWDQYIRELAVFGTNAIELVPPRSDDAADGPHFPLPPMRMMVEMSRIADDYGLDVWIWYPAMDPDYSDPKTVEFALQEWAEVFKALPRVDAVFVPGGDPGHTRPRHMFALLEKQAANLRRYHPDAQMWMSPQGFDATWLQEFLGIVNREQPRWLSGVVYGPQNRMGLPALRKAIPEQYPIRLYPDITHSIDCQLPVPDWDVAYALSEGREVINPRPRSHANIFRLQSPNSIGFITYSEGCNDDVNKFLWSALGWNPEKPAIEILREYSSYFVSDRLSEGFAQGLMSLEANWHGPLLANESVYTTLDQFQTMESTATPAELLSWRFQMGLYRAYYDAYIRSRLINESSAQDRALGRLEEIRRMGARPIQLDVGDEEKRATNGTNLLVLLELAEEYLNGPLKNPTSQDWRARILALGEGLYQSIRMQLAVEGYQAEAVTRAANLDTLDTPLTDAPWLRERFAEIRKLPSAVDQIAAVESILDRTNPGPGGFYDDLGNLTGQPHLVRGVGSIQDPEFRETSFIGSSFPDWSGVAAPVAWKRSAGSLFDAPLQLYYPDLDGAAQYRVRVVYAGDTPDMKIRLMAGENLEVHPLMDKPSPIRPIEFDIPSQATEKGCLTLSWYGEQGLGGNGRGCEVSEVWLMRK